MNTREASALSMGDRQGQDVMVQVRRDQDKLLLVLGALVRGRSAVVTFERDDDVGSRATMRESALWRLACERRTNATRELDLPHLSSAS
jgi:hypothetical protein